MSKSYIAIDLKSFYASVECVERQLDPLDANLLVADLSRGDGTICLAVSAALKSFGIPGRPRLFEAKQRIAEINSTRPATFGSSYSAAKLRADSSLAVDFIIAKPRMALYIDYSTRIYDIYLEFVDASDIHVYSIDEVFIDATPYLRTYGMSAHRLAMKIVQRVAKRTGITATAGIGSNLFLAKVAMDIKAKHMTPDKFGVRIAELDEMAFRREMWQHTPLTDFWRIGHGIATRLAQMGLYTMGDIARCSLSDESWLYRIFGVNAELIIDHAWGREPVSIADIKAYRPIEHSLQRSQILPRPYSTLNARNVLIEMVDSLCLDMIAKNLATDSITLYIGYENRDVSRRQNTSHAKLNLGENSASCLLITERILSLFDSIVNRTQMIRRLAVCACNITTQDCPSSVAIDGLQLSLFDDNEAQIQAAHKSNQQRAREFSRQKTVVAIKARFGKNAILRGVNFCDGATQRERNTMIGGHSA